MTLAGGVRRPFPIGILTTFVALTATLSALAVSCGSTSGEPVAAPAPGVTVTSAVPAPPAEVAGATELRPTVDSGLDERLRSSLRELRSTACGTDRQGTVSLVEIGGRVVAITNRHVVAGAAEANIVDGDGTLSPARVEGAVTGRDAATLDATVLAATGSPLTTGAAPPVGTDVVVAGFPDGIYSAAAGRIVSIEERIDDGGEVSVFLVDVPANSGISGGLVVDTEGRAVGLVAARDPETGNAVAYPFAAVTAPLEADPPGC
jgi:hypothetical protein